MHTQNAARLTVEPSKVGLWFNHLAGTQKLPEGRYTQTHMLPLTVIAAAATALAASPPNILFLMCDSMDGRVVDPSSPISKRVATPTLDSLAATGVNFIRTYAASPQCVPSRTTMLAGRRTDQIRAFSNGNGLAGDPSTGGLDSTCVKDYDEQTCAEWAKSQNVSSTFFDALAPVYAAGNAVEGDECTLCVMGKVDVGQNILTRYGPSATADGWHGGPTLSILTRAADIRKPTKPDPRKITNDTDNYVHQEDWKMHTECIEWLQAEGAARRRRSRQLGASSSSSSSPWSFSSSSSSPPPWFLYCSLNIPHPPFNTNATWLASVDEAAVRAAKPVWPANVSSYHPHDAYMSVSKAVGGAFSDDDIFKTRRTCALRPSPLQRRTARTTRHPNDPATTPDTNVSHHRASRRLRDGRGDRLPNGAGRRRGQAVGHVR